MRARSLVVGLGLAVVAMAPAAQAADRRLVDVVLAEIGSSAVMLSDVALARALGVLGLEPSSRPVTEAEVAHFLDTQLAAREATQLGIEVPAGNVDQAWERAGGAALEARLRAVGIDPAWARRLVETDLKVDRFIDVRFRAFAFVTDFDVDEALGPGVHDETARERTRARLEGQKVARAFAAWQRETRERVGVRPLPDVTGPWPAPFWLPLPVGAAARRK
jgi:hypothetical protein